MIVHARPLFPDWEVEDWTRASAGITAAMTRPTTSSMIAALINTVPMRDCWKDVAAGSLASEGDVAARWTGDGERVVGRERSIALFVGVVGL